MHEHPPGIEPLCWPSTAYPFRVGCWPKPPPRPGSRPRRKFRPGVVVKAQIHAGGRGKGGGVVVCKSALTRSRPLRRASSACSWLPPNRARRQKGAQGLGEEQGTNIARELYLAVVLDRGAQCLTVMASPDGGMDIEEVAAKTPERIFTTRLDGGHRIWPFQARSLLFGCGLTPTQVNAGTALLQNLVRLAAERTVVLVEINPLAVTAEGELLALDGKMDFDEKRPRSTTRYCRSGRRKEYRPLGTGRPASLA